MKKTGRCPKCEGTKIGRLARLPDSNHVNDPAERVIGHVVNEGILSNDYVSKGPVEAYVCTECGYFEEHVTGARNVPWEKIDGFQWHVLPQPPPFR